MLEVVYSFLDLSSQKKFSLSCKRLRGLFGLQKNLDRIVFRVQKDQDVNITQNYKHLEGFERKIMTAENLTMLSKSVKSYKTDLKIQKNVKTAFQKAISKNPIRAGFTSMQLLQMLPHFNNLTSLELIGVSIQQENLIVPNEIKNQEVEMIVEMNQLEILKIDIELLMYLNNRFAKFSGSKLKKLKLVGVIRQKYNCTEEDYRGLKQLISSQKNLRKLSVLTGLKHIIHLFNAPLEMSCKLRSLSLRYCDAQTGGNNFNSIQQANLSEFLASQYELEKIKMNVKFEFNFRTMSMQHVWDSRLTIKLTHRFVIISDNEDPNDFSYHKLYDLSRMPSPDLTTKRLNLSLRFVQPTTFNFNLISEKFPELETIKMDLIFLVQQELVNFSDLKHLHSATIVLSAGSILPSISIPTLKRLAIKLDWESQSRNIDQHVVEILQQNEQIEEVELDLYGHEKMSSALEQMER